MRPLRPPRFAVAVAVAVALGAAVALAACGEDDPPRMPPAEQPLRIGAKNFTEQAILGELYVQALRAVGFAAVLRGNVGSTELIHSALRRGALDMYPEYIGVLLSEIHGRRTRPRSPTAAYEEARALERRGGFELLEQTPFSNANALGVKPAFARRHRLRTISDLRRLPGQIRIAAPSEFKTRFEGLEGLRERYGVRDARVVAVKADGRYRALERGDADVAVVFTTDAQLAGDDYVVLDDPRRLFASGHVAPIISSSALERRGERMRDAIDALTRRLGTAEMREMNAQVDLRGRTPRAVAAEFLRAGGSR